MNDVYMCVCILGWFLNKPWLLTCPSINKAFYLFIYLNKLNIFGIRGTVLKLVFSYFQNRYQFTVINNMHLELNKIYLGAPQE